MTELQQRVIRIVSSIMAVPVESLSLDSSADTIESWDSMQHMSLVLALEQEFGVSFDDDQVLDMLSVRRIAEILSAGEAS